MSETSQFTDIPAGKIAAIVTYLEMRSMPQRSEATPPLPGALRQIEQLDLDWYFDVYKRIGADLLWFSRLARSPDELASALTDPDYAVYMLEYEGQDEAILELDFREEGQCELTLFGVSSGLVGRGVGRALMQKAIEFAWSRPIERFWVHTGTLDHPRALPFYVRSGFTAYRRQVEIADDPRLTGALPRDAAPQVPIIEP
ncbi:MAG: GNAT family N-acetyltransferase [Hyphomicrobiaceae bacterium]|nr:GNAT family N-acetyltransferase [Hyphomicrobiaceae bacterium]